MGCRITISSYLYIQAAIAMEQTKQKPFSTTFCILL